MIIYIIGSSILYKKEIDNFNQFEKCCQLIKDNNQIIGSDKIYLLDNNESDLISIYKLLEDKIYDVEIEIKPYLSKPKDFNSKPKYKSNKIKNFFYQIWMCNLYYKIHNLPITDFKFFDNIISKYYDLIMLGLKYSYVDSIEEEIEPKKAIDKLNKIFDNSIKKEFEKNKNSIYYSNHYDYFSNYVGYGFPIDGNAMVGKNVFESIIASNSLLTNKIKPIFREVFYNENPKNLPNYDKNFSGFVSSSPLEKFEYLFFKKQDYITPVYSVIVPKNFMYYPYQGDELIVREEDIVLLN